MIFDRFHKNFSTGNHNEDMKRYTTGLLIAVLVFALYKQIDDKPRLAFYSDPNDGKLHLGFWYDGEMRGRVRKALEEKINTALPEGWFEKAWDWDDPKSGWLTSRFLVGKCEEPLPEIERYFLGKVKDLEKAASSLEL